MGETMYDYCLEQPQVLNKIWRFREEYCKNFSSKFARVKPDCLYLIASGSSLNAAKASCEFMERMLHIEVRACPSSQLPCIIRPNTFFLFISQGGNSTNTIAAIERLKDYPSMALTGNEDCRINELIDHVLIHCGPEKAGPKTKGYTGTVLTLELMALEAACEFGQMEKAGLPYEDGSVTEAFSNTINTMEESILEARKWYSRNEATLCRLRKCVVIGKGVGAQAAAEAALKLQETILIQMGSYEFEEFLHGPSMAIDPEMGGIYLMPDRSDPDYQRMAALANFHRGISSMVYTVGGGPEFYSVQDCPIGRNDPWYTRTFTWSLPSQITGALLPTKLGIEGKGLDLFWKLDAALNIKYEGRA